MKSLKTVFITVTISTLILVLIIVDFTEGSLTWFEIVNITWLSYLLFGSIYYVIFNVFLKKHVKKFLQKKDIKEFEEYERYPVNDELSQKRKHQAGFLSFIFSFFLWGVIAVFNRNLPSDFSIISAGLSIQLALYLTINFLLRKGLIWKID